MNNIITKIKDILLRHTILVRSRRMFYIDKFGKVIEPNPIYKNMTHREWFSNIGLDIADISIWRGYYRNGLIMLYTGLNHDLNNGFPSVKNIISVYSYFIPQCFINNFCIGSIHSFWKTLIGKDWNPKFCIDVSVIDDIWYSYKYKKTKKDLNRMWIKISDKNFVSDNKKIKVTPLEIVR